MTENIIEGGLNFEGLMIDRVINGRYLDAGKYLNLFWRVLTVILVLKTLVPIPVGRVEK